MEHQDVLMCISLLYRYVREYALTRIAIHLLKMSKSFTRRLNHYQLLDLAKSLDWMQLDLFTEPPVDHFILDGVMYYLPGPKMENASAAEYAMAEDTVGEYIRTQDNETLLTLCGILCRERKEDERDIRATGDPRIPIRDISEAKYRAKLFAQLDPSLLGMIFLYFVASRQEVHNLYADWIFTKEDDDTPDAEKSNRNDGPMFGWWSIFMDIAKSGVFGTLPQVHQSNIHQICVYLVQEKKYYLEQKEEMERMKLRSQVKSRR